MLDLSARGRRAGSSRLSETCAQATSRPTGGGNNCPHLAIEARSNGAAEARTFKVQSNPMRISPEASARPKGSRRLKSLAIDTSRCLPRQRFPLRRRGGDAAFRGQNPHPLFYGLNDCLKAARRGAFKSAATALIRPALRTKALPGCKGSVRAACSNPGPYLQPFRAR